jgi:hypothetical protein
MRAMGMQRQAWVRACPTFGPASVPLAAAPEAHGHAREHRLRERARRRCDAVARWRRMCGVRRCLRIN